MKDCRDCYWCRVKIPVWYDGEKNLLRGELLYHRIKGVRCDKMMWTPKQTAFDVLMRETYAFTLTAETCEFYQSMKEKGE